MSATNRFEKYPSESRSFAIDWTNRLSNANDGAVDTIATSAWAIDSGLTEVADSTSGSKAIVQVSGGTALTSYTCENTITLSTSGYTLVDYITVYVRSEPVT